MTFSICDWSQDMFQSNKKSATSSLMSVFPFIEGSSYECQFNLPPSPSSGLIAAALYPPALSDCNKQHNNITSKHLKQHTGVLPDWIDICTRAPSHRNSQVNQHKLAIYLKTNPSVGKAWVSRILDRIDATCAIHKTTLPIVYLGGKTCNIEWNRACTGSSTLKIVSGAFGIVHMSTPTKGTPFYILVGHDHPSAFLMSGGDDKLTARYKKTTSIISALLQYDGNTNLENHIQQFMTVNDKVTIERWLSLQMNTVLPAEIRTMRLYRDDVFQALQLILRDKQWSLYLNMPGVRFNVELHGVLFVKDLFNLVAKWSLSGFKTISCDGFFSAWSNDPTGFLPAVDALVAKWSLSTFQNHLVQ